MGSGGGLQRQRPLDTTCYSLGLLALTIAYGEKL